eukprot:jgi/Hompol1/2604/HPOL_002977-RA
MSLIGVTFAIDSSTATIDSSAASVVPSQALTTAGQLEEACLNESTGSDESSLRVEDNTDWCAPDENAYLREKLWWIGMIVMLIGEMGNFAAYGFAPAVLVAPLGTVALISNALIAPIFLSETLRKQDIFGIVFTVIGTGIILGVSSQTSEPELSPDDIVKAIMQQQFFIYFIVTASIGSIMFALSYTPQGRKYIFVDLLIVAVFGGYTVLATKALSSLLKLSLVRMLSHWITYLMIFVLATTAVLQVKHLNRSLSVFDSVEVIPTNFVLFTTSSIVGSAILYNDLQRTNALALLGVVCMFFGVILITGKRRTGEKGNASDAPIEIKVEEEEDVDEGIVSDDAQENDDKDGDRDNSAGSRQYTAGTSYDRTLLIDTSESHRKPESNATSNRDPLAWPQLMNNGRSDTSVYPHTLSPIPSVITSMPASPLVHQESNSNAGAGTLEQGAPSTTQSVSSNGQLPPPARKTRNAISRRPRPRSIASDFSDISGVSTARSVSHQYTSSLLASSTQPSAQRPVSYASISSRNGFTREESRSPSRQHPGGPHRPMRTPTPTHTAASSRTVSGSLPTRMADATLRGISNVFSAVGTHKIRQMELDHMSDTSSFTTTASHTLFPHVSISERLAPADPVDHAYVEDLAGFPTSQKLGSSALSGHLSVSRHVRRGSNASLTGSSSIGGSSSVHRGSPESHPHHQLQRSQRQHQQHRHPDPQQQQQQHDSQRGSRQSTDWPSDRSDIFSNLSDSER